MQPHGESLAHNAELELALSQGLDLPLLALRAAMESLHTELARDADSADLLCGALEEVKRLGHNVRELLEFASAPTPMPLTCTVLEILLGARTGLPAGRHDAVTIAFEDEAASMRVDGPLLARSLRRLLENALEAGSEHVMLMARPLPGAMQFTVFDDAPKRFDAAWAPSAFRSTKRNHLGLGLALAERDIKLLEGSIEFTNGHGTGKCVTLVVPDQSPEREVA